MEDETFTFIVGIVLGAVITSMIWSLVSWGQKERAIEVGAAHYNSKTGAFEYGCK